ncbi:MAG: aconitate hydratase AcnA [candidate division WOR-3 bacterium]
MKGLTEFKKTIRFKRNKYSYFSISEFSKKTGIQIEKIPFSIRILLENLIRNSREIPEEIIDSLKKWDGKIKFQKEIPFYPSRVLLQDFTGVPLILDLAAMRNKMKEMGKDPKKINPFIPCHLIIDHSVQVDYFGTEDSLRKNMEKEYERNKERYVFLKWAQNSFKNLKIFPPGSGIIHQVNLEYISDVITQREIDGENFVFPDTVIGTDSHTTMINGIGVLGWGVGGIEAEAALLGEPVYFLFPEVVGVKLKNKLKEGVTPTDLVLYVTQKLREKKVVGKFVEYFGEGLKNLSVFDRATVANMAPEYGSTCGFFPIDEKVIKYLEWRGKDAKLVEKYSKENLLYYDYIEKPVYSDVLEIDLSSIEKSISGPSRPYDRLSLNEAKEKIKVFINKMRKEEVKAIISFDDMNYEIKDGDVVIAAITSCTNTSNPYLLFSAGLLARNAVKKGLRTKPYVKTSFAPGSIVVKKYLEKANLLPYLEALGFHIVGFGCTTCIGNSGPLPEKVEKAIKENNLIVSACLSGNRNFEARVHPLVKMNFLMSPPLVIAYAIKGTILWNPFEEPIGFDANDNPLYLKDIWPSSQEVDEFLNRYLSKEDFIDSYSNIYEGDENWKNLEAPKGDLFEFDPSSTYIKEPPFFEGFEPKESEIKDIKNARCLVFLGDSITTDHISPAGEIPEDSPAGKYLISLGIVPSDFNTFGARRGNHEVMMRGTFGNVRIKNKLIPEKEGGFTLKFPENKLLTIYEAAMDYKKEGVPLLVIAGKEYGSGSSRDWAAKGPYLLGIKAVIAESFERIHRSNLVQMGILPLEFLEGENAEKIGIKGDEIFDIEGLEENIYPFKRLKVRARKNGEEKVFEVILRLDTYIEIEYIKHGGILPYVLTKFIKE